MSAAPVPPPASIPPEIDRWNWGAFLLNWIWGIGNNTKLALLALVPGVNVVMMFVLGAKGSAWAWRNTRWDGVEHFRRVQRYWAIGGVIAWLVAIASVGSAASMWFGISAMLRGSDVYQAAIAKLDATERATEILGAPIEPGLPTGSVRMSGSSGRAQLSIPVHGSKARGTIYLEATRRMGRWRFDRIELEVEGREERIDLDPGRVVPAPTPSPAPAPSSPMTRVRANPGPKPGAAFPIAS